MDIYRSEFFTLTPENLDYPLSGCIVDYDLASSRWDLFTNAESRKEISFFAFGEGSRGSIVLASSTDLILCLSSQGVILLLLNWYSLIFSLKSSMDYVDCVVYP